MPHNSFNAIRPLFMAATLLSVSAVPSHADTANDRLLTSSRDMPIVLAQATTEKKKSETEKKSAAKKPAARNPWVVQCGTIGEAKKKFCRVQNVLQFKQTGQRMLGVLLQARSTAPKLAMQFALPHGLYLPAGMAFKIDEGEEKKVVIETCNPDGCYASIGVDEKSLETMKKGTEMLVSFQALSKKPITIPISLKGFTTSIAKVKLDP